MALPAHPGKNYGHLHGEVVSIGVVLVIATYLKKDSMEWITQH